MLTYQRYLEAKREIDDASLSPRVLDSLKRYLGTGRHIRAVELGAGIGTMPARLIDLGIAVDCEYTMIDVDRSSLERGWEYLENWASSRDLEFEWTEQGVVIRGDGVNCELKGICGDAIGFARTWKGKPFGLLVAHLFLDLIDVRSHLHSFLDLLDEGGVFYLSSNFDGVTSILPGSHDDMDSMMIDAYHSIMDRKSREWGYPRSKTGSEVISLLMEREDVELVDVASSDWVVIPRRGSYSRSERDFLHFLVQTIGNALDEEPSVQRHLEGWLRSKHLQIDHGEMVLIIHQLDMMGVRGRIFP